MYDKPTTSHFYDEDRRKSRNKNEILTLGERRRNKEKNKKRGEAQTERGQIRKNHNGPHNNA